MSNPFALLPDAPRIAAYLNTWQQAEYDARRYDGTDESIRACMQQANDEPFIQQFMQSLGYALRSHSYRNHRPISAWVRSDYRYSYLEDWLFTNLKGKLHFKPSKDKGVVQYVSSTEILGVFYEGGRLYKNLNIDITDDRAYPVWCALLLHKLKAGGPDWTIKYSETDEIPGTAQMQPTGIYRRLPEWPVRYAEAEPIRLSSPSGNDVHVLCWAALPPFHAENPEPVGKLLYISSVGNYQSCKGLWADMQDNRQNNMFVRNDLADGTEWAGKSMAVQKQAGRGVFATYWNHVVLEQSKKAHMVMQHTSMFKPRAGQSFLHVTGIEGLPDLDLFKAQLNIASPYPIPQGADYSLVWELGQNYGCIERLPARGCAAFWIKSNDAEWSKVLATLVGADADNQQVEDYGQAEHVAVVDASTVEQQEVDTDDESDMVE